jgi:hypothetical protein
VGWLATPKVEAGWFGAGIPEQHSAAGKRCREPNLTRGGSPIETSSGDPGNVTAGRRGIYYRRKPAGR